MRISAIFAVHPDYCYSQPFLFPQLLFTIPNPFLTFTMFCFVFCTPLSLTRAMCVTLGLLLFIGARWIHLQSMAAKDNVCRSTIIQQETSREKMVRTCSFLIYDWRYDYHGPVFGRSMLASSPAFYHNCIAFVILSRQNFTALPSISRFWHSSNLFYLPVSRVSEMIWMRCLEVNPGQSSVFGTLSNPWIGAFASFHCAEKLLSETECRISLWVQAWIGLQRWLDS